MRKLRSIATALILTCTVAGIAVGSLAVYHPTSNVVGQTSNQPGEYDVGQTSNQPGEYDVGQTSNQPGEYDVG